MITAFNYAVVFRVKFCKVWYRIPAAVPIGFRGKGRRGAFVDELPVGRLVELAHVRPDLVGA